MRRLSHAELLAWLATNAAALDAQAGGNPFASAAWLQPYVEHCCPPQQAYAVLGEAASGWMLLQRSEGAAWRALNNYYASLYTPWAGGSASGGGILQGAVVDLMPLAEEDATRLALQARRQGWWARRYDCFANWYLPCEGLSFADFMAQRPSQLVNTWKRKAKRFARGDEGARLQLVSDAAEVEAAMDAYEAVYAKSWKQAEPYPGFIRAWARVAAARGWLRLGLAWQGETPIAAQLWFTVERRAYIFKLAYDEDFKPLSAGTVLSAALFEQALDQDRVVEMDYLTGNDAYKASWMTHCRQRVGLVLSNPLTPQGLWRGSREALGAWSARWRRPAAAPADNTASP